MISAMKLVTLALGLLTASEAKQLITTQPIVTTATTTVPTGPVYCTASQKQARMCMMIYKPVVGFDANGNYKTYGNSCVACAAQEVEYYFNQLNCPGPNARIACTENTVCGLTSHGLEEFGSNCDACFEGTVTNYFAGECPQQAHVCTEEEKAGYPCMTLIYDPVCATFEDGSQQTLSAGCQACPTEGVISYVEGECEETKADAF